MQQLFFGHVRVFGGPAPVRRYLPELIDLVLTEKIDPGKVFGLALPLAEVAEAYRAMDEPGIPALGIDSVDLRAMLRVGLDRSWRGSRTLENSDLQALLGEGQRPSAAASREG